MVEVWELMEELRLSKEKEREDQKEVVVYLKSEIDKQKDAALELERRYAELVSEQGAEETRMAEELEASRRLNKAQAEEENAILSEQARKLELHAEYMRAQEHAKSLAAGTEEGQARLEALQAEVERLNSLLPILTHHEATAQGGARAVPLLVLEALRDFPIKRELQREGWMAVASLLAVKPADENARQLKEAGALSLALTTLQVHEDHLDVQSAAIGFVWKLMFCDAPSREQAADSGATHLILRAIARHPNERGNLAPARIIAAHRMLLYNAAGALRVIIGAEMADLQADAPAGILNSPTPIAAAAADGAAAGEGAHSPPPSGRPKQHAAAAATPSPALPPIGSGNATAAGGEGGEGGEAPSGGRGARGAAAQARSAPLLRSLQARAGGGRAGGPRGRKRTTADDSRGAARGRKASTVEQSAEQKKRSIAIAAQALVLTCKAMRDMPRHSLVQEHGCGAIRSLMLSRARHAARDAPPTSARAGTVALTTCRVRAPSGRRPRAPARRSEAVRHLRHAARRRRDRDGDGGAPDAGRGAAQRDQGAARGRPGPARLRDVQAERPRGEPDQARGDQPRAQQRCAARLDVAARLLPEGEGRCAVLGHAHEQRREGRAAELGGRERNRGDRQRGGHGRRLNEPCCVE